MPADPFSRPSLDDLHAILESIDKSEVDHGRSSERLDLNVPAEVVTLRGNTIAAMTREISRSGIGLLHRGAISPGLVTIRMASESRQFEYQLQIEWCHPTENGMFLSGGRFVKNLTESE